MRTDISPTDTDDSKSFNHKKLPLKSPLKDLSNHILYFHITQLFMEIFLKEQFHFILVELEHFKNQLIELEHLPKQLIGELFDARAMT